MSDTLKLELLMVFEPPDMVLNWSLLEEQQVSFTTEPSFQSTWEKKL